jgi:hypothetical protein
MNGRTQFDNQPEDLAPEGSRRPTTTSLRVLLWITLVVASISVIVLIVALARIEFKESPEIIEMKKIAAIIALTPKWEVLEIHNLTNNQGSVTGRQIIIGYEKNRHSLEVSAKHPAWNEFNILIKGDKVIFKFHEYQKSCGCGPLSIANFLAIDSFV